METSTYYPFRSQAVKDSCLAYLDSLVAKQWPIESETRTVPTTFGLTFVRISGPASAPPLVLLHGAGSTSLMWAPNIEALSAEYRTIAVDQIGEFGRSICTRPPQSMDDLLSWMNELFDGLELRGSFNLAGLSYGGALAALYALRFPGRVNKAVLLAPGNTVLRIGTVTLVRLMLAAVAVRRCVPSMIRWMFADMARKDPEWAEATIELLSTSLGSLQPHKVPFPPVLTDAEWGSLRAPTLFLVGEHEVIYSAQKAVRRLKRVAPQVIAEIVPGAGHDLSFVQAAMVNQRIIEFLRSEHTAASASKNSSTRVSISDASWVR